MVACRLPLQAAAGLGRSMRLHGTLADQWTALRFGSLWCAPTSAAADWTPRARRSEIPPRTQAARATCTASAAVLPAEIVIRASLVQSETLWCALHCFNTLGIDEDCQFVAWHSRTFFPCGSAVHSLLNGLPNGLVTVTEEDAKAVGGSLGSLNGVFDLRDFAAGYTRPQRPCQLQASGGDRQMQAAVRCAIRFLLRATHSWTCVSSLA